MPATYLWIVFLPLLASIFAGLVGPFIDRRWSHRVTIAAVGISTLLSIQVFYDIVIGHGEPFEGTLYTWGQVGGLLLEVGFLVDALTATMMMVVTFVSLMVHIYTIGYMDEDEGYQRFFSYISLFTFAMLMLVMSNNFLQLFFGWEAVGVVSYLLIGFWYTRPVGHLRQSQGISLVNRVGDLGFLLGIAAVLYFTGTLNYLEVFETGPDAGRRDDQHLLRRRMVGARRDLHLVVHRRDGQIGAISAARVAARFDGGPNPHLGLDPRRHHGHCRDLHGGAHVAAVRAQRIGARSW